MADPTPPRATPAGTIADILQAALPALGADGASARLWAGRGSVQAYSSDGTAAGLDRAEESAGEGPGTSAAQTGRPVLVRDLRAGCAQDQWPGLRATLGRSDVGRFLAVPLAVRGVAVGVLALYSNRAGPLTGPQWAVTRAAAAATAIALIGRSEREPALDYRIHQATGMVMAQTGQNPVVALALLRARAFSSNSHLGFIATEVIDRRVSFNSED